MSMGVRFPYPVKPFFIDNYGKKKANYWFVTIRSNHRQMPLGSNMDFLLVFTYSGWNS